MGEKGIDASWPRGLGIWDLKFAYVKGNRALFSQVEFVKISEFFSG